MLDTRSFADKLELDPFAELDALRMRHRIPPFNNRGIFREPPSKAMPGKQAMPARLRNTLMNLLHTASSTTW